MSKITFRADDNLVEQLETLDISKSEAMREALRSYLADEQSVGDRQPERETDSERHGAIDDVIRDRVDELLTSRLRELDLEQADSRTRRRRKTGDISVTVSVEDDRQPPERHTDSRVGTRETGQSDATRQSDTSLEQSPEHNGGPTRPTERQGADDEHRTECNQCGESISDDHVYCPNCGEKRSRRLFCDCGDEIRSDWSFCPGCGRRTPAADVLGKDTLT